MAFACGLALNSDVTALIKACCSLCLVLLLFAARICRFFYLVFVPLLKEFLFLFRHSLCLNFSDVTLILKDVVPKHNL